MVEIWVSALTTVIISGLTGFFGWFFTRKQYNESVKGQKVANFDAAIEAYKKMYEDMIDDLKEQINDLKGENASLKDELSETRKQVITLTNFVLASALQKNEVSVSSDDVLSLKKIVD